MHLSFLLLNDIIGWKIFIKRRTAVKKINLLPVATAEQLALYADVCAICYQDLQAARITKCKHFFHGVCLRKWMYVQDTCPLCHEIMFRTQAETAGEEPLLAEAGGGMAAAAEQAAQAVENLVNGPAPQ